jgi:hypothetical protein
MTKVSLSVSPTHFVTSFKLLINSEDSPDLGQRANRRSVGQLKGTQKCSSLRGLVRVGEFPKDSQQLLRSGSFLLIRPLGITPED